MGRALVEIHQPPFSFAAMETENDVVAFLQSEYADANCEMNGDGDRHDEILRIFSLGAGEHPGSALQRRAVEAAPRINDRSLAISNGKVFFRSSEAAMAAEHLADVSLTPAGTSGDTIDRRDVAISADGSCIAFTSRATDLLGPGADTNGFADAFVRDRATGVLERVSVTTAGAEANGDTYEVAASGDCRWVTFSSMASNLTGGGPRGISSGIVA